MCGARGGRVKKDGRRIVRSFFRSSRSPPSASSPLHINVVIVAAGRTYCPTWFACKKTRHTDRTRKHYVFGACLRRGRTRSHDNSNGARARPSGFIFFGVTPFHRISFRFPRAAERLPTRFSAPLCNVQEVRGRTSLVGTTSVRRSPADFRASCGFVFRAHDHRAKWTFETVHARRTHCLLLLFLVFSVRYHIRIAKRGKNVDDLLNRQKRRRNNSHNHNYNRNWRSQVRHYTDPHPEPGEKRLRGQLFGNRTISTFENFDKTYTGVYAWTDTLLYIE